MVTRKKANVVAGFSRQKSLRKMKRTPKRRTHRPSKKNKRGATGWRVRRAQDVQILECSALAKIPWLVHGFTLRPGGASVLNGKRVFNLGHTEWDTHENVIANRKKLLAALDAKKMHLINQRQFHSALARVFDAPPGETLRGDAAITKNPNLLLAVLTADCVPILLVDTKHRVVAAVHAGWRGTL
jgi:copper oxidase (laccase) domain-containing protein